MKILNSFFQFISNYNVLFQILTITISLIAQFKQHQTLSHNRYSSSAKFRMDNIVYPLFEIIEPYMESARATALSFDDAERINAIIKMHRAYLGGKILYYEKFLIQYTPDSFQTNLSCRKNLNQFYNTVSLELDRLSIELGIPKRTLKYRVTTYRLQFSMFSIFLMIIICASSLGILLPFMALFYLTEDKLLLQSISAQTILSAGVWVALMLLINKFALDFFKR